MKTLRNKLHESLLDDEDEIIRNEYKWTDTAKEAGVDVDIKGDKVYINNTISINNNKNYYGFNMNVDKLKELSDLIFNQAFFFGNKIEYINLLSLVDVDRNSDKTMTPITSDIDIKDIGKLNITSFGYKSADDKHIDKHITLHNIDTLSLSLLDADSNNRKWVVNILKGVNVNNMIVSQLGVNKYSMLADLNHMKIDNLYIPYGAVPGVTTNVIKINMPAESVPLFDALYKNNKIGKIYIRTELYKSIKSSGGVVQRKNTFELVKTKTGYKLLQ